MSASTRADQTVIDIISVDARVDEMAADIQSPDAELLATCAGILEMRRIEKGSRPRFDEPILERESALAARYRARCQLSGLMARARRLPATTPAGIYGKAAVLASCYGATPRFAADFAKELLANQNLRRVLWPAETPEAAKAPVPGFRVPPPTHTKGKPLPRPKSGQKGTEARD